MTQLPANAHLNDDQISGVLDDRLPSDEAEGVRAHLSTCSTCAGTLAQARTVSGLLRGLPEVPLPRDFRLTATSAARPVAVSDPPNLVRLRRWYTASRVVSGSLAAAFIAFVAATFYVDTQPGTLPSSAGLTSSQPAAAPAIAPQAATPAREAGAPTSGAPASASRATQPGAPAVSRAAPQPAPADGDSTDQQAATKTVGPLPTPPPTLAPLPTRAVPVAAPLAIPPGTSSDAPWRFGAVMCGVLALLALLGALIVRRRIQQSHFPLSE